MSGAKSLLRTGASNSELDLGRQMKRAGHQTDTTRTNLGEDARRHEAPRAREEVDGRRVDRVIDLPLEAGLLADRVHDGTDPTDDDGRPRLDDRAGRGDADEAWRRQVERAELG